MKTIIITSTSKIWNSAKEAGDYRNSTIDSMLDDVGFIHATSPNQTIDMLNRHFTDREDLLLLLVDVTKVSSEIKFEAPLSGRKGLFPHIYGPLNIDAVYKTLKPIKNGAGKFLDFDDKIA